ncbi:MAG TPA: 4-(cytidine 5'-diphospho)-2-C-methyl-D-erythritol kinase [Acidimicrobiia bacterium]
MTALVRAPAKLTLSLRVLGTRPDGFHELEALTVSLESPCDDLELTAVDGTPRVTLSVDGADDDVPDDERNLVARAVREAAPGTAARVQLRKQIPAGAGLGGGSSDAAAALRWLRDECDVSPARIADVAASLGSDVPFCIDGGPAWMRGRGEVLEPVSLDGPLHVLVAVPPWRLSTPAVYRAWDELGAPVSRRTAPAPPSISHLVEELRNDLEPAAERVEPRLAGFRQQLEAITEAPALLAGSGSACWTAVPDPQAGAALVARVHAELPEATLFEGGVHTG